jgi:hypothetical protein
MRVEVDLPGRRIVSGSVNVFKEKKTQLTDCLMSSDFGVAVEQASHSLDVS